MIDNAIASLTFANGKLAAILHIEGAEKHKALEAAEKPGPIKDMPVRAILRSREPVILYWCP